MTLAEKIAALRGARKMSQGDLAEQLEVSRQSVSKWETGQAVPELDKIIKLADLFGVSVDELVRDEEKARPESVRAEAVPAAEPETKIVYVDRPRRSYTPVQTLGIIFIVGGLVMLPIGMRYGVLLVLGGALAILGLPLLLAKKHPVLIELWLLWAAAAATLCNPMLVGVQWNPFYGFSVWWRWMTNAEEYVRDPVALLLAFAFLAVSVLALVLPLYTGWLCWKRWRRRREERAGPDAG